MSDQNPQLTSALASPLRRQWLDAGSTAFVVLAGLAGFCAYFSMYAFRKPFTAVDYADVTGWGLALDFKIALILAQVAGYALSKLIGIRLISGLSRERRGATILLLIGIAWLALLAFAVLPTKLRVLAMFCNGLPLGLIWGLVFSYMEGRRTTEILGAVLCASFILSSGVVKSVGVWLMEAQGVGEAWMPAVTGAVFMPLLALSVLGLMLLPAPNAADEAARTPRAPMPAAVRRKFFLAHAPGLILLLLAYLLFTALRDLRDNFSAELWSALGQGGSARVFTLSELPVALLVLVALALLVRIDDNHRALRAIHFVVMAGAVLIGLSTLAYDLGALSPMAWMVLSGGGLYLAYTPFNAVLFDRLLAATRQVGTAGFLIYLADASGYLASVCLLLLRNFMDVQADWLSFFKACAYAISIVGLLLMALSARYFQRQFDGEAGEDATHKCALPAQGGATKNRPQSAGGRSLPTGSGGESCGVAAVAQVTPGR